MSPNDLIVRVNQRAKDCALAVSDEGVCIECGGGMQTSITQSCARAIADAPDCSAVRDAYRAKSCVPR